MCVWLSTVRSYGGASHAVVKSESGGFFFSPCFPCTYVDETELLCVFIITPRKERTMAQYQDVPQNHHREVQVQHFSIITTAHNGDTHNNNVLP